MTSYVPASAPLTALRIFSPAHPAQDWFGVPAPLTVRNVPESDRSEVYAQQPAEGARPPRLQVKVKTFNLSDPEDVAEYQKVRSAQVQALLGDSPFRSVYPARPPLIQWSAEKGTWLALLEWVEVTQPGRG